MTNSKLNRRKFIHDATTATGGIMMIPSLLSANNSQKPLSENKFPTDLKTIKKPLAIAMWDYNWILRHHRYGEFENWDTVLEGLAERGYNAIRMDAISHL